MECGSLPAVVSDGVVVPLLLQAASSEISSTINNT
jgi:hypothetical protein